MKKVLYMHTGSGNHGCEAIVRTTSKLLGGPKDTVLWSYAKHEDIKYGVEPLYENIVVSEQIEKFSCSYFEALFKRKVLKNPNANMDVFLKKLFSGNIAVSVGGDNYCYEWSAGQLIEFNKKIRKYCKYSVFWGCSVEPDDITPELEKDLAGYDLITARESISYECLKKINPNTVFVSDPAFLLDKTELPLPENFKEKNTVGINISPLILQYKDADIILKNYEKLISYILENTDMNVCFIPHVIWENNDDREVIKILCDRVGDSDRICVIEDCNCTELKGYISRCRFFVGARTHATIAAYSTLVPTLVAGYSTKSRGIARDLFGSEEHYVVPVQKMTKEDDLLQSFLYIEKNEETIKAHLTDIMPEYCKKAEYAKEAFDNLIK